ncbi:hypothetical protein [Parahaliea aestuarii]|uniref:Uncharacterized protein n=1 Tax=Parahaliea aestuarii TaxID=1852021 RepID=A0A5C8ZYF3_9GAMM|nr:hypothetical protein [Parahaliea aestuarii]TXS92550.1 hypothetical protein FVW59_09045 [Parahaliea aestuarii]
MMQLSVIPGDSIGAFVIGWPRHAVNEHCGEPDGTFRKSPLSKTIVDSYELEQCQVFYDESDCAEYIEASRKAGIDLIYFGHSLFDLSVEELLSLLSTEEVVEEDNGCSYIFPKIGMALWRSSTEQALFDTVGVGALSYFQEHQT